MLIVPILIGVPVAFFLLPSPHFAAFALPAAPTNGTARDWLPPVAHVASIKAMTLVVTSARPAVSFLDLILPPLTPRCSTVLAVGFAPRSACGSAVRPP